MLYTLELHDLSCGACAATIRTALDLAGFESVRVELRTKPHTVTVELVDEEEHLELLKHVLRSHGYPPLTDEKEVIDHSKINFA